MSESKRAKPFLSHRVMPNDTQLLVQSVCVCVCVFVREKERWYFFCVSSLAHRQGHDVQALLYEALNLSEVPGRSFQLHQLLISSVFHSTTFAPLDHKDSHSRCSYECVFTVCALKKSIKPITEMLIHCYAAKTLSSTERIVIN